MERRHGLQILKSHGLPDRVPLCMGDEVPIQGTDGRCGAQGERAGEADVRGLRDTDRERRGEQGSCSHTGECTTGAGAQGDHEEAQGAFSEQIIR